MSKLLIVESPAKAKTIKKYLGSGCEVIASMGHVRDLPKSKLSVDIADNFKPNYEIIAGKEKLVNELVKVSKRNDEIFLATDPDREGEAISWHLAYILGLNLKQKNRVTFNEITKSGVTFGMAHPRNIDLNLVNAQQARRILDRIVGYKLSPFLSQKIRKGMSAGRVQSVAVRIIVDREEEIRKFIPEEYWTIDAKFMPENSKKIFGASFYGTTSKKIKITDEKMANGILKSIENGPYIVDNVKKGTRRRLPSPPFITSTLQQEASKRLGFQAKRTMKVAQELYEGVEIKGMGAIGLITYMRTDSLRVSEEALKDLSNYIEKKFGNKYLPSKTRYFKSKSSSQDGHEAIRPTMIDLSPEKVKSSLSNDQYKLYKLIWERFTASQMAECILNTTSVDIGANGYIFRASGYTIKFDGFTTLYQDVKDDEEKAKELPQLEKGMLLKKKEIIPNQHFTEPPARYTEASLIKALEEDGIGRPSTYAATISTITAREYVVREGKSLKPTELGEVITKLLKEKFPDIVNVKFTAKMETDLDTIEEGKEDWTGVLEEFYDNFSETLKQARKDMKDVKIKLKEDETDIVCEKCGRKMVIKVSRYGKFIACSGYPECKNTKKMGAENGEAVSDEVEETDVVCEKCGRKMVIKHGRYGKFMACPGYPECKNIKGIDEKTGIKCPNCDGEILKKRSKRGRVFFGCSNYPDCDFVSWDEPTDTKCPKCGKPLFKKKGKSGKAYCMDEKCGYEEMLNK
ncbi:MAG: DNA topoisomerase 1 [Eubacteriales bacterium SKADARSKE-1]|nr:DNA topoisomerase 1 [Eubacteriales bacterium SKADARSKE-1]